MENKLEKDLMRIFEELSIGISSVQVFCNSFDMYQICITYFGWVETIKTIVHKTPKNWFQEFKLSKFSQDLVCPYPVIYDTHKVKYTRLYLDIPIKHTVNNYRWLSFMDRHIYDYSLPTDEHITTNTKTIELHKQKYGAYLMVSADTLYTNYNYGLNFIVNNLRGIKDDFLEANSSVEIPQPKNWIEHLKQTIKNTWLGKYYKPTILKNTVIFDALTLTEGIISNLPYKSVFKVSLEE